MIIACVSYGVSTSLFLAPNSIVAGGVSGIAVMITHFYQNIPIGTLIILFNIPILVVGIKMHGIKFISKCLLTVVVLGVITDLLAMIPLNLTNDGVLASLYAGICQGIGIGLFVRYQFSSGGTELLGRIFSKITKRISIPVCVGLIDGFIVILGAILTKNPSNMLHALIVIFLSTKVSEIILVGLDKSKLCIIISDKGEEISKALIEKSPRGITMMDGQGMYTHKEHNVLMTCVKNHQLSQLKEIVKNIDSTAFIIINESIEVRGKGFKDLNNNE